MPNATVRANAPTLPEEPMTAEQWAAFDFEPWTHTEDPPGSRPPTKNGWTMGATLCLSFAWRGLHCTGQKPSWWRASGNWMRSPSK